MLYDFNGNPIKPLAQMSEGEIKEQFKIRCSSLDEFLKNGRNKETFGETAKSLILKMAMELCYNTRLGFTGSKQTEKGNLLENDSIELLNCYAIESYTKNEVRFTNECITGCPDIIDVEKSCVIDIKTSYTLDSFYKERFGKGADYTNQLRGYLFLLGADYGFTCHTLLNTPKELWKFGDNESMHNYDHIPASDRIIISNMVKRDTEWEEALVARHQVATQLFLNYIDDFMSVGRHIPSLEDVA